MEAAELDRWALTAASALGVTIGADDVAVVLDLARDAAHGIARPAAPVTAFIAGIAVGQGLPLRDAVARLSAVIPDDAP